MNLRALLDIPASPPATIPAGEQAGQGEPLFWVAIAAVALIVSAIATLVLVTRRRRRDARNDTSANGGKP